MEIIRLSQCIANVPLQKRLSILENLHHQSDNTYSVHELCEALDVARGTFYNHIFRRADRSQRDQEQTQLMRLVQQAFDDSGQRYGAEKIRITLAEGGIRVSTKRIATIMQELDLRSIRLDSKKQFKKHQKYRYPCRFDISQRPRQAVYFHRIYNAPAKVRCEAIVFRYGTAT